ncbi:MAG: tetratricopeptide repeat protein, partial [Bdellovibrionota bacterium]
MVTIQKYFINRLVLWQGLFVAILITVGCSTANKEMLPPKISYRPPTASNWPLSRNLSGTIYKTKDIQAAEDYLNRIEKEDPKKTTFWWSQYKKAQIWQAKKPAVSCELFKKLSRDPEFPIRKIAELRAYEVCPDKNTLDMVAFENVQYDKWLEGSALDVAIVKAKRDGNKNLLVDLYLKKSKLPLRKEEKIEFTREALQLARGRKTPAEVTSLEQRLYGLSPSLNPRPDAKEAMNLATDFRFYRNFGKAREYYYSVIKSKNFSVADKISAYRGIRASYRLQLNREEALKTTEKLTKFVEAFYKKQKRKDLKTIADVNIILARDYWTEQKVKQAERVLESLLRRLPAGPSLAEAFWILGRMAEEKQDFATAVIQYEKALAQPAITRDFKKRVNWYYAWNLRKQKDFAKAIDIFKTLKQESDSSYDYARYSYWLAYSLREKGDSSEGKSEFKSLISKEPLSYYGLLAHRDLNLDLPVKTVNRKLA